MKLKNVKTLVGILCCFCTIFLFVGCGTNDNNEKMNHLTYVLEQEPSTLDPAKSSTLPESSVELQLYEGLTRLDEHDIPQPAAAKSWEISADGLTYIFHLRDNLTWSNGEPLTAKDFEYGWKRALNAKIGASNAFMLYVLKNGENYYKGKASADDVGVKAIDDKTLVVTLESPAAYFLGLTAYHTYYPIYRPTVEENPNTWATDAKTIVGNGPFKLVKWKHSGEMEFVKNEYYWDADSVKLTSMDWPISESQSTRLALVEGGEADLMVEPPVADQQRLADKGLFKVAPSLGTYYYVFNVTAAPLDNPKVRKALSMVIDRKMIVDTIVHGGKTPAFAFIPPGLTNPATKEDFRKEGGPLVEENVVAAKALLLEAGYGPNHPLPPVTILFNTNEMHKAIAEAVQAIWTEKLGVEVKLQNQESKVFLASREQGNYMVARASWIGDYADPQTFLDVFVDESNDAQYHNPDYQALMNTVHNTVDVAERQKLMHEAEKMIFDDAVIMPIYYTTGPFVTTGKVAGYHWSTLGTVDFKNAYRIK